MADADPHRISTLEQLAALYDVVGEPSILKETDHLTAEYAAMIAASPFVVVATSGARGLDVSPRGDPAGFVVVRDPRTLLLPERRGNNRVDGLRNLLRDPRIALLFLIPGIGETLRVSGTASITVEPARLAALAMDGRPPKCVVEIVVERVFFQCARAIHRSKLWAAPDPDVRARVPTPGAILAALSEGAVGGAAYDRDLPARQASTLY